MKRLELYFCIVTILWLHSCESGLISDYACNGNMVIIGSLQVNLIPDIPQESWATQYMEHDDTSYLLTLNHVVPSVEVHTLSKSGLEVIGHHQVKIKTEGPGSVNEPVSFYGYQPDSIIIFPKFLFQNSLVYSPDSIRPLQNRNTLIHNGNLPPNPIVSGFSGGPVYFNEAFYVLNYPTNDVFDEKNINVEANEFAYKIDGAGSYGLGISYPSEMIGKTWPINALLLSRVKGHDDIFVYNWPIVDYLVVVAEDHAEVEKVNAESTLASESVEPLNPGERNPGAKELFLPMIQSSYYPTLLYDDYRRLYYRFARHPLTKEVSNPNFLNYNVLDEQPFSVLVLDTDFKVLCEHSFPDLIYDLNAMFVGEKGLYIPQSHPKNEAVDENTRVYDIFEFN
jgi:hypothetical protein